MNLQKIARTFSGNNPPHLGVGTTDRENTPSLRDIHTAVRVWESEASRVISSPSPSHPTVRTSSVPARPPGHPSSQSLSSVLGRESLWTENTPPSLTDVTLVCDLWQRRTPRVPGPGGSTMYVPCVWSVQGQACTEVFSVKDRRVSHSGDRVMIVNRFYICTMFTAFCYLIGIGSYPHEVKFCTFFMDGWLNSLKNKIKTEPDSIVFFFFFFYVKNKKIK